MKKFICAFLFLFSVTVLSANEIIISFQPKDNTETIDSIHATNLTKGQTVKLNSGESLLIAPATSSDLIKISDSREGYLYPNPSEGYTTLGFYTALSEEVFIAIYDMQGKMLLNKTQNLTQGTHRFHLSFPAPGLYLIGVFKSKNSLSLKTVYMGRNQQEAEIRYMGSELAASESQINRLKSAQNGKSLDYMEGDVLHYTIFSGDNTTVISDVPVTSKTVEVEFYECKDPVNRHYKIVQIGEQWWMAENLAYLSAVSPDSSGSPTAKHYYVYGYNGTDVNAAKATNNYKTYGVLYNWPAVMNGSLGSNTIPSGVQGVCPAGWHLPSDAEWTKLENYLADNGYNWDGTIGGGRNKIAKSMAATTNWHSHISTGVVGNKLSLNNKSGFSALPGGYRIGFNDLFSYVGSHGYWWSSTDLHDFPFYAEGPYLAYLIASMSRAYNGFKADGFSVRCVKD